MSKATDLDKIVAVGQTMEQVQGFMKESLAQTSILYQADKAEKNENGNWVVAAAADETGEYQVFFFEPGSGSKQYYAIFFKDSVVTGKDWFDSTGAAFMERILSGEDITS